MTFLRKTTLLWKNYNSKKLFLFVGSDLNSIRHIEGRGLNYDLSSVAELLQKGYVSAPRTIYKEIKKLNRRQ